MGKKKFIDKKNSATYRLVFKESSSVAGAGGPIGFGEGADRVFVRVDGGDAHVPGFDPDAEEGGEDSEEREEEGRGFGRRVVSENARRELLELGFPDDGYNYLQHLRDVGPSGRIGSFVPTNHARLDPLCPDVKAYDASNVRVLSSAEENEHDSKALVISENARRIRGPTSKVIDLDVAALLDKDDNESLISGDELEDDFVAMANEGAESFLLEESGSEKDDSKPSKLMTDQLLESEGFDDSEDDGEQCERPARFLDEQFDLLALREYDNDDIGELDDDDLLVRGPAHISKFNNVMSDFLINSTFVQDKYHTPAEIKSSLMGNEHDGHAVHTQSVDKAKESDSLFMSSVDKSRIQALAMLDQGVSSDEQMELVVDSDNDDGEGQWDCETIVSTYSNLDNHPAKICAFRRAPNKCLRLAEDGESVIRLGGKQQLPVDYLPKRKNSHKDEKDKSHTQRPDVQLTKARSRADETKEEKKARKAAVKQGRRAARALKKDMKLMYKDESQRARRTAALTGPATLHL